MDEGTFTKIIYTGEYFTMNGLYFSVMEEGDGGDIRSIEHQILSKYISHTNRIKEFSVGSLSKKPRAIAKTMSLLNISGVWESENKVGLTCKWMATI